MERREFVALLAACGGRPLMGETAALVDYSANN